MKIFGIGLSKTGTNSLTDALNLLGYNIAHYPPENMFEALEAGNLDGCTDIPTALRYKELDERFPGSKFILTVRRKDDWLESITEHFKRRPASTLNQWGKDNRKALYGGLTLSECDFRRVYDRHHMEVFDYFGDRRGIELLVLNICDGEGWDKLCEFLGHEIPIADFPHRNTAPKRTQTIDVVYPYASAGQKWEELRYSIRSVEENFLDLRDVWIIGDQPNWLQGYRGISKERPYDENEDLLKNRDYTQSILWAALHPEVSDPFVVINDDHYMVAPMTAEDIANRPLIRENLDDYTQQERKTANRAWQYALWEQYDRNKGLGLSGFSYECHTPCLVHKLQIIETWALFGYWDGKLIWKTAYYNLFPPKVSSGYLSEVSGHKAGFYGDKEETYEEIAARADSAIYLNHNDDGLTDNLKIYLQERFPNPSKYEIQEDKTEEL